MLKCRQVLEVVAGVHGVPVEEAASVIYKNTQELYFPWELWCVCYRIPDRCSKS